MKRLDKSSLYLNKSLSVLVATIVLISCGNNETELSVADLRLMEINDARLEQVSGDKLTLTLQNGLYLNSQYYVSCDQCEAAPMEATTDTSAGDRASDNYSTTTTQESDVDESDRVKYDGSTLYLASNNDYQYWQQRDINGGTGAEIEDERARPHVRVMTRQLDDSLIESALITTPATAIQLNDLYLHEKKLALIYDTYVPSSEDVNVNGSQANSMVADLAYYPINNSFGLTVHDITAPNEPNKLVQFQVDGSIMSSRRIDNKIYLVSRFNPQLPSDIEYPEAQTEQEQQAFYRQILNTEIDTLLPKVSINEQDSLPLVKANACYLPAQSEAISGYASVVTLTTFDLNQPDAFESICVLAPLSGFYSSSSGIYLYGSQYQTDNERYKTIFHQFKYNETHADYVASGTVPGSLAWNNPHLRLSEKDGYLRVITSETDWSAQGAIRDHRLFVLKANAEGTLESVAILPNEQYSAKIGKPDEDIYAVRYFGSKAYVVTFRRTDPLYVIDLSDPLNPFIQGELEIPGYSGYLQPLNEHYVLGIGQQIDPNTGFGLEPVEASEAITEGAKAELYDVSDPTSPEVVTTLVYENRHSVAQWDYRALTQLKVNDEQYKFAFPLQGWEQTILEQGQVSWQLHQSMQLIDVNVGNNPQMSNVGSLVPESNYWGNWGDRAVIHDDVVYYIRNNQVWQSYWSTPDVLNGPY